MMLFTDVNECELGLPFCTNGECINQPQREKICLQGFANNTEADQPAHARRLISTFVIRFLESIISKLATSEISIF